MRKECLVCAIWHHARGLSTPKQAGGHPQWGLVLFHSLIKWGSGIAHHAMYRHAQQADRDTNSWRRPYPSKDLTKPHNWQNAWKEKRPYCADSICSAAQRASAALRAAHAALSFCRAASLMASAFCSSAARIAACAACLSRSSASAAALSASCACHASSSCLSAASRAACQHKYALLYHVVICQISFTMCHVPYTVHICH